MSEKKAFMRPVVPEGKARFVTTTQGERVEGQFFCGYKTTWEKFQKEVPYQTPKRP